MTFKLSKHSVEELKDYLLQRGVCEEAATNFQRNRVSGLAFLKLTEDDLKEFVPLIGVQTDIRDILKEHQKVS